MSGGEVQVVRLDDQPDLSLSELASISGLSEAELLDLVDFGVLSPVEAIGQAPSFCAHWILATRSAYRLRCAFDLDSQALAITLTLLLRVRELEADLQRARVQLPGMGSGAVPRPKLA